jgi:hypothetical protein
MTNGLRALSFEFDRDMRTSNMVLTAHALDANRRLLGPWRWVALGDTAKDNKEGVSRLALMDGRRRRMTGQLCRMGSNA